MEGERYGKTEVGLWCSDDVIFDGPSRFGLARAVILHTHCNGFVVGLLVTARTSSTVRCVLQKDVSVGFTITAAISACLCVPVAEWPVTSSNGARYAVLLVWFDTRAHLGSELDMPVVHSQPPGQHMSAWLRVVQNKGDWALVD